MVLNIWPGKATEENRTCEMRLRKTVGVNCGRKQYAVHMVLNICRSRCDMYAETVCDALPDADGVDGAVPESVR